MNFFYQLQNQEVFQGNKKLKSNIKCYFEGWYFKNTGTQGGISFIPGIQIEYGKKSAFIQVITNTSSYYISYPFSEFRFSYEPFSISIAENHFSLDSIKIKIEEESLKIYGELFYKQHQLIKKNLFNPNIMGPFCFLPFMECRHAIISMKHLIYGTLNINNNILNFNNGIGYIEKDWGTSFPSSYIWAQANNFSRKNASFFISIATIPYSLYSFTGFICSFLLDGEEYRFTTYNSTKMIKYRVNKNGFNIKFKNKDIILHIYNEDMNNSLSLKAPRCGAMKEEIYESINSSIHVCLLNKDTVLFEDISLNCGLEIVL